MAATKLPKTAALRLRLSPRSKLASLELNLLFITNALFC